MSMAHHTDKLITYYITDTALTRGGPQLYQVNPKVPLHGRIVYGTARDYLAPSLEEEVLTLDNPVGALAEYAGFVKVAFIVQTSWGHERIEQVMARTLNGVTALADCTGGWPESLLTNYAFSLLRAFKAAEFTVTGLTEFLKITKNEFDLPISPIRAEGTLENRVWLDCRSLGQL